MAAARPLSVPPTPTDGLTLRMGLDKLAAYPHTVLTWVGDDGFPVSVAVSATSMARPARARSTLPRASRSRPTGTSR